MTTAADVLLSLGGDLGPWKQSLSEAEKLAEGTGQRTAKSLLTPGNVMKGFGLVSSTAFGIAAAGAVKLENAMAKVRAETGITAQEADRAGKAINAMAGRNMQAVEEIAAAWSKVNTDLGVHGEEADKVT